MAGLLTRMDTARAEAALVARARTGDRDAQDALVRAFAPEVHGTLFRIVGNHEDAEDLAQETFVRALRSLELYRGEGRFGAWLLRIAVHVGRDHLRKRGRQPFAVEAIEDVAEPAKRAGADEDAQRRELERGLARAVDRLPGNLRAALALRVLEGREYDEVADALGVRPATARTHVMKARRALERMLGPLLGTRSQDGDEENGR